MAKQQDGGNGGKGRASSTIFLVDASPRSRELGAVLEALARVRLEGAGSLSLEALADVEELLARREGAGTVVLDPGRVPAEDIGFVRRFLERQDGWRLLLVGDDAQDARARGLLALPRSQWLPWPPDLDQLATLLPGGAPAAPRRAPAPAPAAPSAPAPPTAPGEVDVGSFLEELLAGDSLSGDGAPRYLYRCDEPLRLAGEVAPVAAGLTGLLSLARRCAGEGQVVNVTAEPAEGGDGTVRIRIDFPLGPLTDGDLPGLFEGAFDGTPDVARDVEAARHGADELRSHGAAVDLLAQRPGRLRLEILLPGHVPASAPGG